MTAIADPPPLAVDAPKTPKFTLPVPVATISADLMPAEILGKRRLGFLKRRLAFALVALVALLVLGDMLVRQQTSSADGELAGASSQIATLNAQLTKFNGVLTVQSETQAIQTQLDGVMDNDVSWPALLGRLAAPAPAGLRLTSIDAEVDDPDGTSGSATSAATSSLATATLGTITLSGSAPAWKDVATYVRGLSADKDFVAVNPSTVSHGSGPSTSGGTAGLTFTITVDLTDAVLSNRYSATTTGPPSDGGSAAQAATTATSPALSGLSPKTSSTSSSNTAPSSKHAGSSGDSQEAN